MVEKELNKVLIKPLALTASAVGLLEGIAWTVFSILCICCYEGSIEVVQHENTTNYFESIYTNFLASNSSNKDDDSLLMKPRDFFIFMCFYLVFSVLWLLLSGFLMWAMIHNQWQLTKYLFGSWSAVTILTSIIDIVLTALITRDYKINEDNFADNITMVTYGIVMSLAARGYVLWIINIIFAFVLIKFLCDIIENENHETRMPIIHGYESSETTRPWSNDSGKDFWASPEPTTPASNGYTNHGFERSQSFFPMQQPPINREEPYTEPYNAVPADYEDVTNEPNQSFATKIAQKFAKIGKNKGRRSPPNPVPPPFIPDPDYTPPGSPNGLKSVLRSKSNYA